MTKSKYCESPSSKALDRSYKRLRYRLQATIESTIGRPIHQYSSVVNVLRSDPNPPNFYQWRFSMAYPSFPLKGISKWTVAEFQDCEAALDAGHLEVVSIDPQHLGQHQRATSAGPYANSPYGDDDSRSAVQQDSAAGSSVNQFASSGGHIQNEQSQASNMASPHVLAVSFQTEMDKMLGVALAKKEQEMNQTWKNKSLVLSASLRRQLEEANQEIERLQQRTRHLESNAVSFPNHVARKDQGHDGQMVAVHCDTTNHSTELRGEHARESARDRVDGSFRNARARDGTHKEGAMATRHINQHAQQKQLSRRQVSFDNFSDAGGVSTEVAPPMGQITPQNVATKEEEMDFPTETDVRPPTSRHTRPVVEIRSRSGPTTLSSGQAYQLDTIKNNWGEFSRNTLSTVMLADIHTLSRTLLFNLATLSKIVDVARASALLRDAVDQRNSNVAKHCRTTVLTSGDVKRALENAVKVTNISESSSAPPPLPDNRTSDSGRFHGHRSNNHTASDPKGKFSRSRVNSGRPMLESLPFRETPNVPSTPIPKTVFEKAFDKWMRPNASGVEPFRLPSSALRQELSDEVLCRGNNSDMFGKTYDTALQKAQMNRFVRRTALDLEDSLPIRLFDKEDHVIQVLALIAELFEGHNQKKLEQKTLANDRARKGLPAQPNPSSSRDNGSPQSSGFKRARFGQSSQPLPKRSRRESASSDKIIPHWQMMDHDGPGMQDGRPSLERLAALRQKIMQIWKTPLARAWISRADDGLEFLEAVLSLAKRNSFEDAKKHVNRATVTRLQHDNQGTPHTTAADFRIVLTRPARFFKITPQMLDSLGLRHGPEGFLESSKGDNVPQRLKSESVENEDLYDASPTRTYPPALTPVRATSAPRINTNLPPICSARQVQGILKRLIETYGAEGDDSCLMESAIAFKDEELKEDFVTMNHDFDVRGLDCFTDFLNAHYDGTDYKIGLFVTKEKSSVWETGTNAAHENWDTWVAITRQNLPGGGTMLVIWDSNWGEKRRRHAVPTVDWAQHVLIDEVRKGHNLKSVWIGGTGNRAGGNPLQLSINFIHHIVRGGKVGNFPAGDVISMKAAGYAELDYMRGIHADRHWLRPGTFDDAPSALNSHARNRHSGHGGESLGREWSMGPNLFMHRLAQREAKHDEEDSLYEPSVV